MFGGFGNAFLTPRTVHGYQIYHSENTGISCLRALSECPKLESLDIQDCAQVTSLEAVKS